MTPLRKRTLDYMTLKGYAESTKKSYIFGIQQFALHFNSCPSLLNQNHVAQFLQYLLEERKVTKSTVNTTYSAIKILFVNVLDKPWDTVKLPRVRKDRKLPIIFTPQQVISLIDSTPNLKHRSVLSLFYSSGMRKDELCQLRLKDLVFSRKRVFIRKGKGNKDRYALLTDNTIALLKEYIKIYRPNKWLFAGQNPANAYGHTSIQKIYENAKARVGLNPEGGVHQLRHCFATHAIENGMNLPTLQKLLGHASLKTTQIYLHLTNDDLSDFQHPLDAQ